ncbi:hypothetical protein B0G73_112121 [Paraburkholderia sp. BL25I1N1]|nr:hypothetical protein B0G73_112121 [Paraburkholderia sp. BL25I1N1]
MNTFLERHLYRPALVTPVLLLVNRTESLEFNLLDLTLIAASTLAQHAIAAATSRRQIVRAQTYNSSAMSGTSLSQ